MTSWEIGRKLDNGKYVVEKELGRGAFGITYKVRESRTYRLFAVKTLNESLQQRSNFQAIQVKFINEAIKLAKCSHPNIAGMAIESGNRPQSVFEWLKMLRQSDSKSNVRLIPSPEKQDLNKPLIIYDPEIAIMWNEAPHNIHIHEGKTLANLKPENFYNFQEKWTDIIFVKPEDLFLPELKFIELENSFPGALIPEVSIPLVFNSSSQTNIIINNGKCQEPLYFENLQLQVTNSSIESRINTLFENFIPENFIPQYKPLPISNILTTRGKNPKNKKMFPILDARIYIPNYKRFKPQEDYVITDLSWSLNNLPYIKVFLEHLLLHISALAANVGVTEIQYSISYLPTFLKGDIRGFNHIFRNLNRELEQQTGIKHYVPKLDDSLHFRTTNIALAQYFADVEDRDLVYSTCIDIGHKTSDISVWEDNTLIYQCSVKFAGKNIFSQFLRSNPKFAEEKFGINTKEWNNFSDADFNNRLDVWLRYESQSWLDSNRHLLEKDEDFQDFIQLMAFGITGLYYYVGIILKVLWNEGKYKRGLITPVYLGGNASRFLNWLDVRGVFDSSSEINNLLSRILSKGSGFKDTNELTSLSLRPKDEVAMGLTINNTKLRYLDKRKRGRNEHTIAGEAYKINGIVFPAHFRINFISPEDNIEIEDVKEFQIPQLKEIPKFLYDYHEALRDLDLSSLIPLKDYKLSKEKSFNQELWRSTQRELDKVSLNLTGDSRTIGLDSTFIMGLNALLSVLGEKISKQSKV